MVTDILHNIYFFYGIALFASILSSALGTGMSFALLPLAALQFGAKESVGIMTIFFLFQNINKVAVFWRNIHWPIVMRLILWAIPGVLLGSIALSIIPVDLFKKVLAIGILLYIVNDMFKLIPNKRQPETMLPVLSLFYGFLSGLIGSGNVVKGPLFMSMGLLKESYLGTYAITSFAINIPKLISYSATGVIDRTSLVYALPFLFISIIGTYIGKQFLKKIPHNAFYYVITASFALSAIMLLMD